MLSRAIQLFLFVVVSINQLDAAQTLYICREDGIRYTSISRSGTPVAWDWRFQGGDIPSSILQNPPIVSYPVAGVFNTYVTTTFDNGQQFEDTFIIVVKDWPLPAFNLSNDTGYCNGDAFSLTLNAINYPEAVYQWSTGASSQSITVNQAGTFWVNVYIKAGNRNCDSVYKEMTVTEHPKPTVNLGNDRLMCQNQIITIDAGAGSNYSYLWSPLGQTTRMIDVSLPGIYRARVTNEFNCFAEDEIELVDSCPHYIFIPNAVSPNQDGLNDIFNKVWNFTPKEFVFRIYNRWGEMLFESFDKTLGWDCNYQDKPVQQDIYVYQIDYLDTDDKWYNFRGTFYIVR
jgi:gliding motility-associated-like protein